ncbi:four-carbon acid sugar kinase family protein [Testudinibacter sp. P80/BLE/0925]|uniref:four-carbon acid sugar kinase family protein n=1 Tax=Testudinibacter sp. TW-1 TaxID=3417757 RepID=UPI003D36C909
MKMLVIADDFTGANDTGVQFCNKQATVDVALNWQNKGHPAQADVIVVNTDSRALRSQQAAERVSAVVAAYQTAALTIYKKTDSTLRGNVGAELEAALNASGRQAVFFCPALPDAGRTVRNGICYLAGVPLTDTEFATDPKTPIYSSRVSEILASQTALPIIEIELEMLRSADCMDYLRQKMAQSTQCLFTFDAEKNQDFALISNIIKQIDESYIIAGSSGLAAFLPDTLYREYVDSSALLFVVASMSEASAKQAEYLLERNLAQLIEVKIEPLLTDNGYRSRLIDQLYAQLTDKQTVLFKTDSSQQARQGINALCKQLTLTRAQLGERICSLLSDIVNTTLQRIDHRLAGLVLTGGDIAIGVAQALQAEHYRIAGEIESGVPFGYLPHTALHDIPIITKAGGFGSPGVFEKVINFIRNTPNKER